MGWGGLTDAAIASRCPAELPTYEVIQWQPRFASAAQGPGLFSPAETAQQEKLRQVFEAEGFAAAQVLIRSAAIAPDVAAYALWLLGRPSRFIRASNAEALVSEAIALLVNDAPDSDRRDLMLYTVALDAAKQNNWFAANQAVTAIQDVQLRLDTHTRLSQFAEQQGSSVIVTHQQQQAAAFLQAQPSYQAVLWAEMAIAARQLGDPALVSRFAAESLDQLSQISDSRRADWVYAGPASHRQVAIDQVARSLAQAHQFDAAEQLLPQIEGDATGTQLAIAAAQIEAGAIDVALPQVLAIADRSFYRENKLVARALASVGDINCSIAVLLPAEVDSQSLNPVNAVLAETLLLWAQADRPEAILALGANSDPLERELYMPHLMAPWVQAGGWETALDLAGRLPPGMHYLALLQLGQALTEQGDRAAAAQVQQNLDDLLATSAAARSQADVWQGAGSPFPPPRPPGFAHTLDVRTAQYAAIARTLASLAGPSTTDANAVLRELVATRQQLLALFEDIKPDGQGIALLGEVALAMYINGDLDEAEATLQAGLALWPQAFSHFENPRGALTIYLESPRIQDLLDHYAAAGWYSGVVEWLVHPALGYSSQPNLILLDLPLSPQGQAILELTETAIAQGAEQAAMDIWPRLARFDEQATVGATIATQVMLNRRDRVPSDAPFVQLDLLAVEIGPLANNLSNSLAKARVYLAIAQGYIALGNTDQARTWLTAAADLTQNLQTPN